MIEEDFIDERKTESPKPLDPEDYKNLSPIDFQQQRQIDWLMYETKAVRYHAENNSIKTKELRRELRGVYSKAIWLVLGIIGWVSIEPFIKNMLFG